MYKGRAAVYWFLQLVEAVDADQRTRSKRSSVEGVAVSLCFLEGLEASKEYW